MINVLGSRGRSRPSSSLNWPRLTKAGGMTRRRSTLRRSGSWSRSWPALTQETFTSRPRASSLSGSPRSWQHGRSPRCHMMGRPWLQFLVDRRRSPKVHGRQQPTRPMLWPMWRRVPGRWQSAAGHKTSSRPHVRLGGRPDQLRSEQRGGHPGPHLGPSSGPGKG